MRKKGEPDFMFTIKLARLLKSNLVMRLLVVPYIPMSGVVLMSILMVLYLIYIEFQFLFCHLRVKIDLYRTEC